MYNFQPHAYIDYTPPRLTEGKSWYVSYSVRNPESGKMHRFRIKLNRWKTTNVKRKAAKQLIAYLSSQLALGWSPFVEKNAPKSHTRLCDALDSFVNIKSRELEPNSMRAYNSYVKAFRKWLNERKVDESVCVTSFNLRHALEYMESVEVQVAPRTYNNYLAFMRDLFNWFKSRGYTDVNPFSEMKKKPKRLTKKIRRIFTEAELSRLFKFLSTDNPEYLAMCLLCYCCFLRPKEIALLRCEDIDIEHQVVRVSGSIAKNDNDSVRTIPTSILPYMRLLRLDNPSWFAFADHDKYDFSPGRKPVCSRKIAKYWSDHVRPACRFSIDLQFYSLKDTGVTNMIGDGVPINFVQQQADHSSIAMTAIYVGKMDAKANAELLNVDIIPTV